MCNKNCCCDQLECVINSYTDYFRSLTRPKRNGSKYKEEYHPFIPLTKPKSLINTFIDIKNYLRLRDRTTNDFYPKFLDAGCGIGNIMLIAKQCNFCVNGIEYNTTAHRLCKAVMAENYSQGKVIKGDILTFKGYKDYDVIYYYVPIDNSVLMKKFTKYLAKNMKIGAIICVNGGSHEAYNNNSFKKILGDNYNTQGTIYEKIKEVAE